MSKECADGQIGSAWLPRSRHAIGSHNVDDGGNGRSQHSAWWPMSIISRIRRSAVASVAVLLITAAMATPTGAGSLRQGSTPQPSSFSAGEPGEVLWTYYDTIGAPGGAGDNILTLINPNGSANSNLGGSGAGTCAMIYVFDDDEEMGECCGCPISPAGIQAFSVEQNLTSNWGITGAEGRDNASGAIAIAAAAPNVAFVPAGASASNGQFCPITQSGACNAGCDPTAQPGYTVSSANNLLGSIVHNQLVTAGTSTNLTIGGLTEVSLFDDAGGDPENIFYLQAQCGALVGNSSGGGICRCAIPYAPAVAPTPTVTATATATETSTASAAATATATSTASAAATTTATSTASAAATTTATSTASAAATATSTATATTAATPTATPTGIVVVAPNLCTNPSPSPTPASGGSLGNYAVLANTAITNSGSTTINGNLGLFPGTSVGGGITVTPPGFTDTDNTNAHNGQNILTNAITQAMNASPTTTIPQELGGQTLAAGAYKSAASDSSFMLSSGSLTLNAQGDVNAVWIFQMNGSNPALTTTTGNVVFQDGIGNPCNVFWQVGSSATIGSGTPFIGNIMAGASITLNAATLNGRALASTAAVTLSNNTINGCTCPGQ